jgi:site-specific DNA recombinase
VEGTHEAIVTKEELDQVAAMVKRQKQTGTVKRRDSKYLFSGKIKCGYCRRAVRMRAEYKIPKISCRTVPRPKDSLCFEGVYSTEPIEKLVLQLIRQQASMAEDTIRRIKEVNKILDIAWLPSSFCAVI